MCINCMYIICLVFTIIVIQALSAVGLVIEEESDGGSRIIDMSSKQDLLCSSGSSCIPLSECTIMAQLMQQSCLQTDKMRGLTCGFKGAEPLVCCPDTCPSTEPANSLYTGECGRSKLYNWWSSKYQGVGAHPWAVRVGFRNVITDKTEYLCCGSILNNRVILTAAHCALAKTTTYKIATVKVGEYDSQQDLDCSQGFCAKRAIDVPLNHIVVHPGYDSKTFRHNIALLVLKTPLNFSLGIQPICLYPKATNYIYVGQRASLVGWGKLAGQPDTPSKQQVLRLPVLPLEQCSYVYGTSVPITENDLCVGGEYGRDACSGFGGAPLILLDPKTKNRYYQIGFVSFGSDRCGALGVPSVYTRVDRYTDWIAENSPKI